MNAKSLNQLDEPHDKLIIRILMNRTYAKLDWKLGQNNIVLFKI